MHTVNKCFAKILQNFAKSWSNFLIQIFVFLVSQYDSKLWRKRVYSDPGEFLNLCREFKCYPNLWALQEWSLWLTPAMFPTSQRFNSIFFLTFLSEIPEETIGHQEEEMDDLVVSSKKPVFN